MNFRVLGCSGSESNQYHPCSFLVDGRVIFDMGSAASRLTIQEQANVTDIFLSHAHLDHTKDVAFFSENVFTLTKTPVNVHATQDTLKKLNGHLLNDQIWPDFSILPSESHSILKYCPITPGKPVQLKDLEVSSVPVKHPGGCVAYLIRSSTGTLVYSGDTGPTEELWSEVNRRGKEVKAILLETSFPSRLQELANVSGHHTPATLEAELKKIKNQDVPVFVYHIKAPYREETVEELDRIGDPRIHLLESGMNLVF